MMRILLLEDQVEHNYKYLASIVNDLRDEFSFTFDNNPKRINSLEYLNLFDLIITSNSFHRIFKTDNMLTQLRDSKLTAKVLSWNHSMTGPNSFNLYHSQVLDRLPEEVSSNILCMDPYYYYNLFSCDSRNTFYTKFYYRLNYHFNTSPNKLLVETVDKITSYFNHWTTSLNDVKSIVNKYSSSPNFMIRLHPAYFSFDNPNNPLRTLRNMSNEEYTEFMDYISQYTIIKDEMSMIDQMDASGKLIFDGSSGTMVESIIRSCIHKLDSTIILHMINDHGNTPVHNYEDNFISIDLMRMLGSEVIDGSHRLTIDDNSRQKLSFGLSVPNNLSDLNFYLRTLFRKIVNNETVYNF